MNNIQSFYEYVILRDILAFILPGGISLSGIYMITRALGINWDLGKILPFLPDPNGFIVATFLILISFLIGHIWDMLYRLLIQKRKWFERINGITKILVGDPTSDSKSVSNHIASEIRSSLGDFLNINWEDKPIEQWIKSGKAYEASLLVSYWIEEEDPRLFSAEVGRPIIQSHLLHVCGLAFIFVSMFCVPFVAIIHQAGINPLQEFDPLTLWTLFIGSLLFGLLLVLQGTHKRDIIVEHAFRVFYVVWRKRVLEREANLEIARRGGNPNNGNRPKKSKP
jgi:hypothetical protein